MVLLVVEFTVLDVVVVECVDVVLLVVGFTVVDVVVVAARVDVVVGMEFELVVGGAVVDVVVAGAPDIRTGSLRPIGSSNP